VICHIKVYILIFFSFICTVNAQQIARENTLFTAGHASAFIGGLYDAFYTYKDLKLKGDFGLGAPDQLDGEILILKGKIYQTQSSGKTFEVDPNGSTPFSVVNFFKTDRVLKVTKTLHKNQLYAYLDSVLTNKNAIYAIHIYGEFDLIRTRAFPKVTQKPYTPLAEMLSLQHFFNFERINGDLVGYYIPAFMEGENISGYHFHFLSVDKQHGGHIIELLTNRITIEIDQLSNFNVALPQTTAFKNFDFKKDRTEEVKKVENGKAN